jgi:hypothetical protein
MELNLLPLIRAHPEVTFHLILPPMATLRYVPAADALLPLQLPFRSRLADAIAGASNVRVYDFQIVDEIVDDLRKFKDPMHFDLSVSRYIIDAVRDGRHRVLPQEMADNNRRLVEIVNRYDLCKAGIYPLGPRE